MEKAIVAVKLWLGDELHVELLRLAAQHGMKLSTYLRWICRLHVDGERARSDQPALLA